MDDDPPLPFPFEGPRDLRQPVLAALTRVVDPEMALSIVDVGLVCGVSIGDETLAVRLTMTSVACPVADLICDEVQRELDRVLPEGLAVELQMCWEPPWSPERMSERARRFMGW